MKHEVNDVLHCSRSFAVKGLGKSTFLFSVRGLQSDDNNVYFNDDSSIGMSDCMKLKSGTVVPFNPNARSSNLTTRCLQQHSPG